MESQRIAEQLTDQEVEVLSGAAVWYAKYHARIIAERADDRSAYAVAQRERYGLLLNGLRKLGIKLIDPIDEPRREPAGDPVERRAA